MNIFDDFKNRIKGKRYQELGKPYRIVLWLNHMPFGYIKGFAWYFVKRFRWEDVSDDPDDCGRASLDTCISICVGIVQSEMNWYYTIDEVFREDGSVISRSDNKGYLNKIFDFIEEKLIEMVDGKTIYD